MLVNRFSVGVHSGEAQKQQHLNWLFILHTSLSSRSPPLHQQCIQQTNKITGQQISDMSEIQNCSGIDRGTLIVPLLAIVVDEWTTDILMTGSTCPKLPSDQATIKFNLPPKNRKKSVLFLIQFA